jgi:hypothetical protein
MGDPEAQLTSILQQNTNDCPKMQDNAIGKA